WSACRRHIATGDSTSRPIADSNRRFANGSGSSELGLHAAEHLVPQRKNEREAEVALHAADRNADQLPGRVQHPAPGDARMTVGEAGDQLVGRALTDVA